MDSHSGSTGPLHTRAGVRRIVGRSSAAGRATVAVVALTMLASALAFFPAVAELDDTPQNNGWGVSGLGNSGTSVNSQIFALERIGNTIYAGGRFTDVVSPGGNQLGQPWMAAFDATTGAHLPGFAPEFNGAVLDIKASPDGGRLFVAGEFYRVNGVFRSKLVALNPATGATDTSWQGRGGGNGVRALDIDGGWLYVAGDYNSLGDNGGLIAVERLGRVRVSNGTVDSSWTPSVTGGGIWDVKASKNFNRVYITGFFSRVEGDTRQGDFGVIEKTTENVVSGLNRTDNDPNNTYQYAVEVSGSNIFIGGSQHNVEVRRESDFALLKFHITDNATQINEWGGGDTQVLYATGNRVYVGCHCWSGLWSADNVQFWDNRPNYCCDLVGVRAVYALDAASGERIDSFLPVMNGAAGAWAFVADAQGCLWTGGDMSRSGGQRVRSLVRHCDENFVPGGGDPVAPTACVVNGTQVSWTPAANDNGDDYVVERSRNGGAFSWAARVNGSSWTDNNQAGGNTYTYRVKTRKGSSYSANTLCDGEGGGNTDPVAPTSCSVSGAVVSWTTVAQDNADDYVVERSRNGGNFSWAARVANTSWTDTNQQPGNNYVYRVRARRGSTYTSRTVCTAVGGGGAPVAPTACSANGNTINWVRAANDNATGFDIERSVNGSEMTLVARIGLTTSWTDNNQAGGNIYEYAVNTVAGAEVVEIGTLCQSPGEPVAPLNCSVNGGNRVVWTPAANDNATHYVVERSRNGGGFSWAARIPVGDNVSQWTDNNQRPGNSYSYRVKTRATAGRFSANVFC